MTNYRELIESKIFSPEQFKNSNIGTDWFNSISTRLVEAFGFFVTGHIASEGVGVTEDIETKIEYDITDLLFGLNDIAKELIPDFRTKLINHKEYPFDDSDWNGFDAWLNNTYLHDKEKALNVAEEFITKYIEKYNKTIAVVDRRQD